MYDSADCRLSTEYDLANCRKDAAVHNAGDGEMPDGDETEPPMSKGDGERTA